MTTSQIQYSLQLAYLESKAENIQKTANLLIKKSNDENKSERIT